MFLDCLAQMRFIRDSISSMAEDSSSSSGKEKSGGARSRRRNLLEIAIAYTLILLVIWTPRPWQKLLWWVAAAAVAIITTISFDGLKAMGLRTANFFRSLWVAGAALLVAAAAIVVAIQLHTLRLPDGGPIAFIKTYWAYALWACVQQFLLLGFFLPRFLRLLPGTKSAAILAASLFALAHLPNPILTPVTLIWGLAACLLFLLYRNLYPLAMAHAILGITIAITVPGPVDHNMRVGLGYLTYHHHAHHPAQ
jgi:membrane protease YdiL (CAAX protease family)